MADDERPMGRPKGPSRINERLKRSISAEHAAGKSLRDLAEKYRISPTRVHQIVKQDESYISDANLRRFRANSMEQFIKLIENGVTPEIACAVFGIRKEGFELLRRLDDDFRIAVDNTRFANLAEAEKVVNQAAMTDWKAALERLSRAKETKDIWKSTEKGGNVSINVTLDWDREDLPNLPIIINQEDTQSD